MSKNNTSKRTLSIIAFFITAILMISITGNNCVFAKNASNEKQIKTANKNFNKAEDVLSVINKYQEKYFLIINRNDILLNLESTKKLNNDRKELKKLFAEVKKQISNKDYLKEYKAIQKRYSKCEEETTIAINSFAENNYNDIDALLNKAYKEVKLKIEPQDFQKLAASEKRWLKEVENYEKKYNSMEFGTIGASIYYDYEINMREFRALLLMLYL